MEWLIFLLIGALAGFSAGLLGIGGGLITVPALIFILPQLGFPEMDVAHIAIATSLAAIVPTSMLSAYKHNKRAAIDWLYAIKLAPGLIVGSIAGVFLAVLIARVPLQIIFSIFLLIISFYLFFGQPLPPAQSKGEHLLVRGVSVLIGAISALLGVGGGTMTVPFLVWRGLDAHKAVGTSAFCGIPIALTAACFFLFSADLDTSKEAGEYIYWQALIPIVAGSLLLTSLGANFAHKLSTEKLKRIFAVLLVFVSIQLIIDVL